MSIVDGYCTLSEVKSALRLSDSIDDTLIENSIEAASRRIDGYCGRFFYKTAPTAVRLFAYDSYRLAVNDISSTTGLIVKLDNDGDGTYEDTLVLDTDYIVEPTDFTIYDRPIRTISMIGGATFPISTLPAIPLVQVTAAWGFDAVPHDVREACVLLSIRQFARFNAALGVMAFADMAITVRAVDPDVRDLLLPYRLLGVA
jgi:hypothetical protein